MDSNVKLPKNLEDKYEFYNFNHAAEILSSAFPKQWDDLIELLDNFYIEEEDLIVAGGAETNIPKKFDDFLYARKWRNTKITGDLHMQFYERIVDQKRYEEYPVRESIISQYVNECHVDFLNGRVALGLEWNKKDLAFDRTLSALRTFYESNVISAGIVITRGMTLSNAFKNIVDDEGNSINRKYGSSSTWMGKLLPRIEARQAGGCPILAIGITENCIKEL